MTVFEDKAFIRGDSRGAPIQYVASQVALVVKILPANAGDIRDAGCIPGSGRPSGGGNGNPLPVFLPGESHGQGSLVGYSLWGCKELEMTKVT